jgi:hypothetical protein
MHIDPSAITESASDAFRVNGPSALLQAVPYLLGFHPRSSLVVVGLHDAQLVVTIRLGLADVKEPFVLSQAIEAMARGGATELVGVLYDDAEIAAGERRSRPDVLAVLSESAQRADCALLDLLVVTADSWRSAACTDADCCPADGHRIDAETSSFAAAATFAGMVALPDREALAHTLDPRPAAERARLGPLIAAEENAVVQAVLNARTESFEGSAIRAILAAVRACDADSDGAERLDDAEVARFGVALSGYQVRDSLWLAADEGDIDGRRLWVELGRRLPSPYDAAPLFLMAWCSWRAGNGALAAIAAQRAIDADPAYRAANLLLDALARGVDPRRVPRLRVAGG